MDFIFSFIGSLIGAFLGSFCFLYYINPKDVISEGKKLEKNSPKDFVKPKGVVIKSPDPEDERKRKAQEFEARVYKPRVPKEEIMT